MSKIVTIDGPGSSGKNSVGLGLAERLGFQFIDSGSIYRAVSYYALQHNLTSHDIDQLAFEFSPLAVRFVDMSDSQRVFLADEDITPYLHSPEITKSVPVFATFDSIRSIVRAKQHALADERDIVMAGRDTGTVIFPDAPVKFYITASAEIRAKRRYQQLIKEGIPAEYELILQSLRDRDAQDTQRAHSPLKPATDAITIDTSVLSVRECVDQMYGICRERGL